MPNTEYILKEAARIIATNIKSDADERRLDLENAVAHTRPIAQAPKTSKVRLEAKLGAIEVTTDFAASALKRAYEYIPKEGQVYICPVCWVKEAIRVRLRLAEDSHMPSLICPDCKAPFPAI